MNSLRKKSFLVVAVLLLQLLLVSETVFAQNKTVKGRVVNDTGQPVQKASVLIKGPTAVLPQMITEIFRFLFRQMVLLLSLLWILLPRK